ncbi:MAG: hypothetical protein LW806_01850, partial [Planctomycetaceae bacterium]|nr:hypothetical protein [Planctomycetaceae bacterium]
MNEITLSTGLPTGSLDAREDVHHPPEEAERDRPDDEGRDEPHERGKQTALHQLTHARDQQTADCRDDIARTSPTWTARHIDLLLVLASSQPASDETHPIDALRPTPRAA